MSFTCRGLKHPCRQHPRTSAALEWVSKLHLTLYRNSSKLGLAKAEAGFLPRRGEFCIGLACPCVAPARRRRCCFHPADASGGQRRLRRTCRSVKLAGMVMPPLPQGCALRQARQDGGCKVKGTCLEGRQSLAVPAWLLNPS